MLPRSFFGDSQVSRRAPTVGLHDSRLNFLASENISVGILYERRGLEDGSSWSSSDIMTVVTLAKFINLMRLGKFG